jgi:polar amino acid transport system substrate-binding protein
MRVLLRVLAVACFCLQLAACGREPSPGSDQAATGQDAPVADCHLWASLINRIRDGSIDLVTGATMTEQRLAHAHFSDPVREEQFALFIRTGETGRWEGESLRDLMDAGMRLGVTDAYVYDDTVHDILDDPAYQAQVTRSRFAEANLGRLLDGEIDAFVEDLYAATSMIRRLGFEGGISRHRLRLGEDTEVRIMYSKATVPEELVVRLNESLERLKESGKYAELQQRYLE